MIAPRDSMTGRGSRRAGRRLTVRTDGGAVSTLLRVWLGSRRDSRSSMNAALLEAVTSCQATRLPARKLRGRCPRAAASNIFLDRTPSRMSFRVINCFMTGPYRPA